MKSDDGAMRTRTKHRDVYNDPKQVLSRFRYDDLMDWVFLKFTKYALSNDL